MLIEAPIQKPVAGPDRSFYPDNYGLILTDRPKVPHRPNTLHQELNGITLNASLYDPTALDRNPNRDQVLALRENMAIAQAAPLVEEVYPRIEYTTKPRAEGATIEQGKTTLHLAEAELRGLPFLENWDGEQITYGEVSIGRGGKKEISVIFEGEGAEKRLQQFQVEQKNITRADQPEEVRSAPTTAESQAAA